MRYIEPSKLEDGGDWFYLDSVFDIRVRVKGDSIIHAIGPNHFEPGNVWREGRGINIRVTSEVGHEHHHTEPRVRQEAS